MQLEDIAGTIANDAIAAYGDDAKGFALQRVFSSMNLRDPAVTAFWEKVAGFIWEIDPTPTAGCPAERAHNIRMH